ncbi:MAG: SDR family oxidoreductase [Desulfobacterales bacterium]
MSKIFSGKVVLVSGGTSGIGKATALLFAQKGARVIIIGRNQTAGDSTVEEIKRKGDDAEFFQVDVSNSQAVTSFFRQISEVHHRLDCAFNAAGAEAVVAPTALQAEEHFNEMVAVDFKGTWLCLKNELQLMQNQKAGTIVNCSALAGIRGSQGAAIYAACKHAIIGLTQSVALEYAESNIRINAVCPGIVQTPGMERTFSRIPGFSPEEVKQWGLSQIPVKRFGSSDEVAQAVIWLCSDASSYLTGHSLVVDGGLHCK